MSGIEKITFMAALDNGKSRRTTVILDDPTTSRNGDNVVISGRQRTRSGDLTDTFQVIVLTADETVTRVPMLFDRMYGDLRPASEESAQSKEWGAR